MLAFLLAASCGGKYPYCVGDGKASVEINWGRRAGTLVEEYSLDCRGSISFESKNNRAKIESAETPAFKQINDSLYCGLLRLARNSLVETGACHVDADTAYFLVYKDINSKTMIIADWNPDYLTEGNKLVFEAFDSLNAVFNIKKFRSRHESIDYRR